MDSNSTMAKPHPQFPLPPLLNPKTDQEIPPANPPPPARRRARQVSSRYMIPASPAPSQSPSPISSSNPLPAHLAASPKFHPHLPLPNRAHRRQPASSPDVSDSESDHSSFFADENQPALPLGLQCAAAGTQRRRALRLFGDNEHSVEHMTNAADARFNARKPRPGTPMVYAADRTCTNAAASSMPRAAALSQRFHKSMNLAAAAAAAAGRRMTANGSKPELATPARPSTFPAEEDIVRELSSEAEMCSVSGMGGLCDSPPLPGSKARHVPEVRSSMPEADLLPTMSGRRLADGGSARQDVGEDSLCRASTSLCHRSLNLALTKSVSRPSVMPRPLSGMGKATGPCLPMQLMTIKAGVDSRKGRKTEDVHLLRLLHNQYLQWRFMNAKAQVAVNARTNITEKSLYEVSTKISELRDSVTTKRIELEQLKISRTTSMILEAQMPHLDKWALVEGDHASSLSAATKALQDASLRVPLMGNVKADVMEIAEILDSATNIMESLSPSVGRFLPEAEGLENVIFDLAKVANSERAIIEECGDLLSEAHRLQVKECSLRGHLIQLKRDSVV